ncbi:hypothetical protein AMTR_s00001p00205740 [Amborella trichopoda]|uniref:Uncharacterized protein n=1 Tax=Amborella trichopoda TaxID=13333 RepID=W1NLG8_AMBTC|nr:hypothetical protein AMTR_s00001p00205740 [Amborella trichopoda]
MLGPRVLFRSWKAFGCPKPRGYILQGRERGVTSQGGRRLLGPQLVRRSRNASSLHAISSEAGKHLGVRNRGGRSFRAGRERGGRRDQSGWK